MSSTNRGSEYRKHAAYYTPDDLAEILVASLPIMAHDIALEPSVGGGAFARALAVRTKNLDGFDIDPEAPGLRECYCHVCDFLDMPKVCVGPTWVVGNPPFSRPETGSDGKPTGRRGSKGALVMEECASLHVRHALHITERHVAFLLRLAFLETPDRQEWLATTPLRRVTVLGQRPSFTGGRTDSCAYGFFWWDKLHQGPATIEMLPRWRTT